MADKLTGNSRVLVVKFEDLLMKSEETVTSICGFVDVKYTENMLEVAHATGNRLSHF